MDPRRWSLARQLFALMALGLAVVVAVGVAAAYVQARETALDAARARALAVAFAVAQAPEVREGVTAADPSVTLQPYAEAVRAGSGTDFVVVMSPAGRRFTHPDPARIGQQFIGHIEPAAQGRAFTETFTGSLGPSVRAVVPVLAPDGGPPGRVVGLVSVGITLESVGRALAGQVRGLLAAGAVVLAACAVAAWLLSRRLRRQTHGLGAAELKAMYEYHDAVLHAVREGLLIVGRDGRLELANDEALRLLGLGTDAVGRPTSELGLPAALGAALGEGAERSDEVHLAGDRVLVVNAAPAVWEGRRLGTVVTLRDRTDLLALTGELDSVRGLAESLRSQAHEAANRLHSVVSLIELGRPGQALEFATAELAGVQELTDRVVGSVGEPVLAALLLGKAAQAAERGVDLVPGDLDVPPDAADPRDLVTIVGNLLDNALDAALSAPPPRRVVVSAVRAPAADGGGELVVTVADSGPGLDPADADRAFTRGWSTKPDGGLVGRGIGLALVGQAVHRNGGTVTVSSPGPADDGTPGAVFTVRLPL
ncbi:sensor histidine kinase [Kineosporia sp. R_H_3]|uniref:sensor histidine kinase n=1 Tax=Kineosporia sp. R_H_3 TaxID=1961848 RepID=UPI001E572D76|nr:sensor histidine kinase [Kineosporia sp. R_H_3]